MIFQYLFCRILVASIPSGTEYSPSLASRGSPLAEGAGRAADATGSAPVPRPARPPPRGGRREAPGGVLRAPPAPCTARRRKSQKLSVWRSDSPRCEAKELPPHSARASRSFSTRRSGGNAEVPASASRRPAKKGRFTLSSIFLAPRTAVAESECQCVFRSRGKELLTWRAPVGHPVGQKVSRQESECGGTFRETPRWKALRMALTRESNPFRRTSTRNTMHRRVLRKLRRM